MQPGKTLCKSCSASSQELQLKRVSSQEQQLKREYRSIDQFCAHYNPDMQLSIGCEPEKCFFGPYPTLLDIQSTYNVSASYWLVPQLVDLSNFCGAKGKLQGKQLEQCAELIAQNYAYLKVSEVMLFIYRFKLGMYGRFYGTVDPIYIMMALRDFVSIERCRAIENRYYRMRKKGEQESAKKAVTYQQYLLIKQNKERKI